MSDARYDIDPFTQDPQCIKCGAFTPQMLHVKNDPMVLMLWCFRCKFSWWMRSKDYVEVESATSA